MDTRADFQRLLEEMDKVIKRKQEELTELDERLVVAREELSKREADELLNGRDVNLENANATISKVDQEQIEAYLKEQQTHYENQLNQLNDELNEVELLNKDLARDNARLISERSSSRLDSKRLIAKVHLLSQNYDEVQNANFELNMRLAKAESECQMQRNLLKKSHEQDQVLMDAFNDKLESMKQTLISKDDEIKRLRLDNELTLGSLGIKLDFNGSYLDTSLGGAEVENDTSRLGDGFNNDDGFNEDTGLSDVDKKQRIISIANLLRDKDAKIELLKNQLVQATRDLENNANLLEALFKSRNSEDGPQSTETGSDQHILQLNEAGEQAAAINGNDNLMVKCRMLESELETKDEQLHLIQFRMRYFELIVPDKIVDLIEQLATNLQIINEQKQSANLDRIRLEELTRSLNQILNELDSIRELLNQNEQLKKIVSGKDRQIEQLVRELNEMDEQRYNQEQQQGIDSDSNSRVVYESATGQSKQKQLPGMDIKFYDSNHSRNEMENLTRTDGVSEEQLQPKAGDVQQDEGRQPEISMSDQSINTTADQSEEETKTKELKSNATSTVISASTKNALSSASTNMGEPIQREQESLIDKGSKDSEMGERSYKARARLPARFISFNARSPFVSANSRTTTTRETTPENESKIESQKDRLKQLEEENSLLQLSMREILVSIRSSDTENGFLMIDCPSLERLCQLIEAKFLVNSKICTLTSLNQADPDRTAHILSAIDGHGDLFQLVIMKSELDLLRGQNDQLRAELKLQRRECYDFLKTNFSQPSVTNEKHAIQASENHIDSAKDKSGEQHLQDDMHDDSASMQITKKLHDNDQQPEHTKPKLDKCLNCSRLIKLAQHLMECIARIETLVNISDETYIRRLLSMYHLSQQMGKDLTSREQTLMRLKVEYDNLSIQKSLIEKRFHSLEYQTNLHNRICPLEYYLSDEKLVFPEAQGNVPQGGENINTFEVLKMTKINQDAHLNSSYNLMTKNNRTNINLRSTQDSRMTIALLQSIISCLQARLDYKDERLNQLEHLLSTR